MTTGFIDFPLKYRLLTLLTTTPLSILIATYSINGGSLSIGRLLIIASETSIFNTLDCNHFWIVANLTDILEGTIGSSSTLDVANNLWYVASYSRIGGYAINAVDLSTSKVVNNTIAGCQGFDLGVSSFTTLP